MQALWSRAAQIKSCRCKACLHTATALARTTRAGSKRRLNINDLFKAKCYSTLIGTAVFMDAKAKDERRKKWDKAIGEAKAELSEPSTTEERVNASEVAGGKWSGSWMFSEHMPKLQRPPGSPNSIGNAEQTAASRSSPLEAQLRLLDTHVKQSLDKAHRNAVLAKQHTADADVWKDLEDFRDPLPPREPKTKVHIEKMQEMIAKLVVRLLLTTKSFSPKPGAFKEDSAEVVDMARNINEIWSLHTQLPLFRVTDWASIEQERSELNASISTIIQKAREAKSPNHELILAKICYNLLVCEAPPGVETYDLLLRSLTDLGQHEWALIVASSFIEDSRYRPSFHTMQYMLETYAASDNLLLFRSLVQKMRGMEAGLRTRRRKVDELDQPKVLNWANASAIVHRANWLYEKAPRNAAVFDALIKGTLRLEGVRPALKYIRAALRKGNRLTSDTLAEAVQGLLKERSYLAAVSLLRTISNPWQSNAPGDEEVGTLGIQHNAQTRRAVYTLLSMCGIDASLPLTNQIQPHEFIPARVERLLSDLLYGSLDLSTEELSSIPRLENSLELISTDSEHPKDAARHADKEQAEKSEHATDSTQSRSQGYCNDAISVLTKSLLEKPLKTGREAFISSNRIILIETLADRLMNLSADIYDIYKDYLRFNLSQLSDQQKAEYLEAVEVPEHSSAPIAIPARLRLAIRLYLKGKHVKQIKSAETKLIDTLTSAFSSSENRTEGVDGESMSTMAISEVSCDEAESRVMEAAVLPQVLEAPAPTPDVPPEEPGRIGQVVVRPILLNNNTASRRRQRSVQLERGIKLSEADSQIAIMQGRPATSVLASVKARPGSEVPQSAIVRPAPADVPRTHADRSTDDETPVEDYRYTGTWLSSAAIERRRESTVATG
ncbi:pentatricopeptide repeat domain-containing protein-like protein [Phlyctema vagabunda]|uniref:Pentatricopeptide repeat domain-containing protein-like protein n=1 Tax=Phlyctema vagabunda TaxID=108571 RepID=A0ABR4PDW5_9HELO